jgi:hypothetical protein
MNADCFKTAEARISIPGCVHEIPGPMNSLLPPIRHRSGYLTPGQTTLGLLYSSRVRSGSTKLAAAALPTMFSPEWLVPALALVPVPLALGRLRR